MIGAFDPIVAQVGGQHGIATPVSLILIAAAAFAIPLAADRVRLPAIVLEILFGFAVGPWLGFIEPGEELLGFLAEFGLFLLMFLAGFEIDFSRLERHHPAEPVLHLPAGHFVPGVGRQSRIVYPRYLWVG